MRIPENFKVQFTREDIASANQRMGREITEWSNSVRQRTKRDIFAVPLLRGAVFFMADLVREITDSVEIAPLRTFAYEDFENAVERDDVRYSLEGAECRDRSVLLIDDICDSGRTLNVLKSALITAGAVEVRSAVMVKRVKEPQIFSPDWVGFEYKGPEWMVGYGMDDKNRWRNLPAIYTIVNKG